MAYLQCPECRLTVPAAAYYLRGDECPRCLTAMAPVPTRIASPQAPAEPQERPAVTGD